MLGFDISSGSLLKMRGVGPVAKIPLFSLSPPYMFGGDWCYYEREGQMGVWRVGVLR